MAKPELASVFEVPRILEILVEKNVITPEQQGEVIDNRRQGAFDGQIAVERKLATQDQVDEGLRDQSVQIAEASVKDMADVAKGDKLAYPIWFKGPHWGNKDGVNAVSEPITKDNAASAAANIAKLIMILANEVPAADRDPSWQEAVKGAAKLTRGILGRSPERHLLADQGNVWKDQAVFALRAVAEKNGVNSDIVRQYTDNRFAEVAKGIELAKGPQQEQAAQLY